MKVELKGNSLKEKSTFVFIKISDTVLSKLIAEIEKGNNLDKNKSDGQEI